MTINDLKHLEQLLKLCRKQGVASMSIDNIQFKLEELPSIEAKAEGPTGIQLPDGTVLTDEELLLYSATN